MAEPVTNPDLPLGTDEEFLVAVNARYVGQWDTFDWTDEAARERLVFDLGQAIGLAMRLVAQRNHVRAAIDAWPR